MALISASLDQAARLYASNKTFGAGATNGKMSVGKVGDGESFGDFMQDMATSAVDTMRQSEAVSTAGVKGKASAQQVVEAVMAAETTLQTVIAVRDKMVQAYQEIMRMPV